MRADYPWAMPRSNMGLVASKEMNGGSRSVVCRCGGSNAQLVSGRIIVPIHWCPTCMCRSNHFSRLAPGHRSQISDSVPSQVLPLFPNTDLKSAWTISGTEVGLPVLHRLHR